MSIRKFLIRKDSPAPEGLNTLLPDPNQYSSPEKAAAISSANKEVLKYLTPTKRKRDKYTSYDSEQRAKIAKWAIENGNASAVRHCTKEFGSPVKESTVRNLKTKYKEQLSKTPEKTVITSLEKYNRGRPKLLGKYDDEIIDYARSLRSSGAIVNRNILIDGARGILMSRNKKMLVEFRGNVKLDRTWAESLMRRLGYVHRKGTKAARKLPPDFEEIKTTFIKRVRDIIDEFEIPSELVLNFDQTNISIIPCGNWTMHDEGAKQVEITGLEDKRQITALLTCSMAGALLPPQILYQGKTDQCHPKANFPRGWDIFHTENHWSNESTMLRFAETILIPYIQEKRDELDLPLKQHALAIFDCFAAHRVESFINKLQSADIKVVFVPGGCTCELQPLDLSGNAQIKEKVKSQFTEWYADRVSSQLKAGKTVDEIDIELKLSIIKPAHARWIIVYIRADVLRCTPGYYLYLVYRHRH